MEPAEPDFPYSAQTQALTGFLEGHKEEPGSGGKGGDRGGRGGEHKEKPGSHKDKPGSHKGSNLRKHTVPIYGEISSIRGEPMSIRNQPCPRRDGGMEVDGDMEAGSIKIKTLSRKINTQPNVGGGEGRGEWERGGRGRGEGGGRGGAEGGAGGTA